MAERRLIRSHSPRGFNLREQRQFIAPAIFGILAGLSLLMIFETWKQVLNYRPNAPLLACCVAGIAYTLLYYYTLMPNPGRLERLRWINAGIVGLGLSLMAVWMDQEEQIFLFVLAPLSIGVLAITSRRRQSYLVIALLTGTYAMKQLRAPVGVNPWLMTLALPAVTLFISETMRRVQAVSQARVERLEAANEFARQITSSLDMRQVLALLSAALQNALPSDTFFLGFQEGEMLNIELLYDDGEFFSSMRLPLEGTLSSWVLRHDQTLFIPDLREEPALEGVKVILLGKDRTNLSWLGVPLRTSAMKGLIVVGSYSANAFTLNDVELLENLAGHAALALENTRRHAEVERLSRLDSLTGVYNHGAFLELLRTQADQALATRQPLSLIMLDVDYFKQYNDRYGHLVGDQVLTMLCDVIRRHIKRDDLIGRWGGEEFVIALPNASGPQALQVAERIRTSMVEARLHGRDGEDIPAPSVTQGIAVFPDEADEIFQLIDLADRRLYMAKQRGRNQIEPQAGHWQKIVS